MTKLQVIETLSSAETGFVVKCCRLLVGAWHAAAVTTGAMAAASAQTPQQQYDTGMSDSRPLPPNSARQQIDAYIRSFPAMLNRRF